MKRTPLNRGTSQMKRTPMQRGTSTLKQGGPIAPRSNRTRDVYKNQRIPLVKQILKDRPECEACVKVSSFLGTPWGVRESVDCHEVLTRGRSGGVNGTAWLDPDNILAVCRLCHGWITDHPKEALELGLVA